MIALHALMLFAALRIDSSTHGVCSCTTATRASACVTAKLRMSSGGVDGEDVSEASEGSERIKLSMCASTLSNAP